MATLRNYIERIESLEEAKKELTEHIADTYKDAKSEGYDTVVMKAVVKRRKMSDVERRTADELLATYEASLEEQAELPLDERFAPLKREQVRAEKSEQRLGRKVKTAFEKTGIYDVSEDAEGRTVFHAKVKTPETVN